MRIAQTHVKPARECLKIVQVVKVIFITIMAIIHAFKNAHPAIINQIMNVKSVNKL